MRIIQTLKDALIVNGRCLSLPKWDPGTILTSIIAPILTMLLFTCVVGGAMQTDETSYVNFIVPGVILQCPGQRAATMTIAARSGMEGGIMERSCTVPVGCPSILSGHVQEAFIRNMVIVLSILLVAFLIGFRSEASLLGWCVALLIISLYTLTLSWISVYFGMIMNSPEGAGPFLILAVTLSCISSGFASVGAVPGVLQVFAEYQPITPVIDSLRALLLDEPLKVCVLLSVILWHTVLLLLFYILSIKAFKKKSNR